MEPLSVLTKTKVREQNLWFWFINGLMHKSKNKLFHRAIPWGSWPCFAALKLRCCCNTALPLWCSIATVLWLATITLPCHSLVTLLGHSCYLSATVMMLCQSCCQPVSCYFTTVILLASVALLSRSHATLPMAYGFTSVMLFASVMLLCQWGHFPVSSCFSVHCHTVWHCLGT